MGAVSEVLGNHGAPHVIEHNGKKYQLSLMDQAVKTGFEKARLQRAIKALELTKDQFTAQEYKQRIDDKIALYEAGEYEIFTASGMAYMKTVPGMRLVLSLIIGCDENELMGLVLAKKDEIVPLLGLIFRESFPGLKVESSEAKAENAPANNGAIAEPSAEPAVPNA